MSRLHVITGGQTGVDRAALRAAMDCELSVGGWCPPGRQAEDGPIPGRFPLHETPVDRSPWAPDVPRSLRTHWNVRDADATLVLAVEPYDSGTAFTLACAERLGKPVLVVDPDDPASESRIAAWIASCPMGTLHVAGPSEATRAGIEAVAYQLLHRVFAGGPGRERERGST